jgi:hypothetical protein
VLQTIQEEAVDDEEEAQQELALFAEGVRETAVDNSEEKDQLSIKEEEEEEEEDIEVETEPPAQPPYKSGSHLGTASTEPNGFDTLIGKILNGGIAFGWQRLLRKRWLELGMWRSHRRWFLQLIRKKWNTAWDLWEQRNGFRCLSRGELSWFQSYTNQFATKTDEGHGSRDGHGYGSRVS